MWAIARHKTTGVSQGAEPDLPEYKNAKLDSWLSDRITRTVDQQVQLFYKERAGIISAGLFPALQNDPYLRVAVTKKFADAVLASGRPITKRIYKSLRHALEHSISSAAHLTDTAAQGFISAFGEGAMHTVAMGLTVSLGHVLTGVLAHVIGHPATAHLLSHALTAAWHHVVLHSVFGGIATAAAPFFVHISAHALLTAAAPAVVAAVAAVQIVLLPGKLAKEIAPKVRAAVAETLRSSGKPNFQAQNRSALRMIAETVLTDGGSELVKKVMADRSRRHSDD